MFRLFFIILSLAVSIDLRATDAAQIILHARAAVNVSAARLYEDSSFSKVSFLSFQEGELFEVTGESVDLHYDASQLQLFKWYKVQTQRGQAGWLFGDVVAVVLPDAYVDPALRALHKHPVVFDNGYERSIAWTAAIDGRDEIKGQKTYLNPPYKESYLVVTNARGQSALVNYGSLNGGGVKTLRSARLQDVTGDQVNEVILETSFIAAGSRFENRQLEIYRLRREGLEKVFDERLTLTYEAETPSPALFKIAEISASDVRFAYIDYVPCEAYGQKLNIDARSRTQERCMEYVTYSFYWDKNARKFLPLYPESRVPPVVFLMESVALTDAPGGGKTVLNAASGDRLQLVKHAEILEMAEGKKKIRGVFYVWHSSGVYGYVEASKVDFRQIEHAKILMKYYSAPPLLKEDWNSEDSFIRYVP